MLLTRSHCWIALAINSGLLSERIYSGARCSSIASSNTASTSVALMARSEWMQLALLGKLVDHVEHPKFASKHRMVADEVPCPDMITVLCPLRECCREPLTAFAWAPSSLSLGAHAAPVSCPRTSPAQPALA